MKFSTKGRYGIATMYDLAMHNGQGPISLKSIAQRQIISENYLEQLIGMLRKAGYVKSARGAQGGYSLAKDPSEISVGDIIKAMEGPIAPVDCLLVENADSAACNRVGICVARGVLSKVRDSINDVLDSVTLADLCAENTKPDTNE
ncbi:MAG: Rrf2 family transcriptional regulator [Sporomusaceae bacterium]|nr:Rrf2 family transcriptional regulator [Sporomusaceae bacterium]